MYELYLCEMSAICIYILYMYNVFVKKIAQYCWLNDIVCK